MQHIVAQKVFSLDKVICGFLGTDFAEKCDVNSPLAILEHLNSGYSNVAWLNQVHSAKCVELKSSECINYQQEADAQITCNPDIILAVRTADCVPILIYDREATIIGTIHAGWKGALNGIIDVTIRKVRASTSMPLKAIIGPCIRQKSYEVEEDFIRKFEEKDALCRTFVRQNLEDPSKYFFDLPECVKHFLLEAGVNAISDIGLDTFTDTRFFSHRRAVKSNKKCGRNLSVIGIKHNSVDETFI